MKYSILITLALGLFSGCPAEPEEPAWRVVLEELSSGLVSVAGTSASDVWAVGGDPGDGKGPLVLHFDGSGWKRLKTGASGDLWWVHSIGPGRAFFGGAGGTILKLENGAFTRETTPALQTVYGIWGADEGELWAAGGDADAGTGFLWRRDATGWRDVPLPEGRPAGTLFKAFGFSRTDVWFVGAAERLLHWDGTHLTDAGKPANQASSEKSLFTVHGAAGRIVAVGGYAGGYLLESDENGLRDATPARIQGLSGVFMQGRDEGWAVGQRSSVLRRTAEGWSKVSTGLTRSEHLHAVWADPEGGVWAVGGDILSLPLSRGLLLHFGTRAIPGAVSEAP